MKHTIDTLLWWTGCTVWVSPWLLSALWILNQPRLFIMKKYSGSRLSIYINKSIYAEIQSAICIWFVYEIGGKSMSGPVAQMMLDLIEKKKPYFYKKWHAYFTHKLKTAPDENE